MNVNEEKRRVELTARGSQAKRTKFHSELFRRHPITYRMLTAHLSLHTSMITPIEKMSSTSKHKTQRRKRFHNFSNYFANCRCSGGGGGVCLLQPGEQRGHLCFEDSSTSVSTLSKHHGYFRPWSSVNQPSCLLVISVLIEDSPISVLTLGIIYSL